MAVVKLSRSPEFVVWRARVVAYARAVLGVREPRFDEAELRDGFTVGDSPAEYCVGALAQPFESIASGR